MAQVTITQLPQASALTGNESVPIVQNGVTVQTTTGAISGAGALNYPFLTVGQTAGLPDSRYISTNAGLSVTDNGAQGTLQVNLIGAALSLNSSGTGIQVKTGSNTVTARQIAVNAGLSITNGDGVAGNPTIGLGTVLSSFAALTGTGILAMQSGTPAKINILGTTSQTSITNGDGSGNVTVGLASNPVLPGAAGAVLPVGGTASRPAVATNGTIRYNSDTAVFEGYANNAWGAITTGVGVTSVGTGTGLLGGPITSTGTISIDTAVVATLSDSQTLINKTINGPDNTLTNIGNSSLTNSSVTYNGVNVALGSSGTITAINPNALTIGTGLSGTSYNGSSAVTIAIDSTVATLTGSQTLTNKIINGSNNTLSNIANSSLTNSSVTVGTTSIALGATSLTLGGLTSVTVTQDPTSALQLATKQYVDSVAQGLDAKASCVYGTTNNITLSGLATQAGGDWPSTLTAGDRILVKNQTSSQFNGIYVASASTWSRSTDMDTWAEVPSSFVFIESGTTLADTGWVTTANAGGTIDVTAMPWVQFSGAGTYTAGTGLTLTGSQFSLTAPVTAALGGSGYTSYATGDMLYASGSTTLSKLTIGTANYVLTSSGTAPQYVSQSTLSVGSATNATNTAITANSTNATNYLTFVSATTGNLPQLVNSSITCNPSTGQLTGGIAGGAF